MQQTAKSRAPASLAHHLVKAQCPGLNQDMALTGPCLSLRETSWALDAKPPTLLRRKPGADWSGPPMGSLSLMGASQSWTGRSYQRYVVRESRLKACGKQTAHHI